MSLRPNPICSTWTRWGYDGAITMMGAAWCPDAEPSLNYSDASDSTSGSTFSLQTQFLYLWLEVCTEVCTPHFAFLENITGASVLQIAAHRSHFTGCRKISRFNVGCTRALCRFTIAGVGGPRVDPQSALVLNPYNTAYTANRLRMGQLSCVYNWSQCRAPHPNSTIARATDSHASP